MFSGRDEIRAREPGEPSRCRRPHGGNLLGGRRTREQVRLADAGAVQMRQVVGGTLTHVVVEIEDRRSPLVRLLATSRRRQRDGRGNHAKE